MAALSRRNRNRSDIWPGFVDALASLLMVIIFLLLVFVLAQFFLGEALSGRDNALKKLDREVAELVDMLALERKASTDLRGDVSRLSGELQASISHTDRLKLDIEAGNAKIAAGKAEISRLAGDLVKLQALKNSSKMISANWPPTSTTKIRPCSPNRIYQKVRAQKLPYSMVKWASCVTRSQP